MDLPNGRTPMPAAALKGPDDASVSPLAGDAPPEGWPLRGRHLFGYYLVVFLSVFVAKELTQAISSRVDVSSLPRVFTGVHLLLDHTARLDEALNTIFSLYFSLLFSLPVAIVYSLTKAKKHFDPAMAQTTILLSMVVTGVILVIGDEVARAFGLAGVVTAVSFRNRLKDSEDAVYVFLAIVVGMACGARLYPVAGWTSIVITTMLYLMWRYRFGRLQGRLFGGEAEEKGEPNENKKKRKGAAPSPPPPSLAEAPYERTLRLRHLARISRPAGEKKRNAAIVVDAKDLDAARRHIEGSLNARDLRFRLARLEVTGEASGILEFVGRLGKQESVADLTRFLSRGLTPEVIRGLDGFSLKDAARPEVPAVPEAAEDSRSDPRSEKSYPVAAAAHVGA